MKMLVCGKGGCGKSTIVALLSKEMAERGNRVLVIDNDESNIGLHHRLGMDKPADFMNSDVFVDELALEGDKYEIKERE
jgi:CO dehydrogenase maturation factor